MLQLAAEAAAKEAAANQKATRISQGREIAEKLGVTATEARAESLAIAAEMGADLATLRKVAEAVRLARKDEIKLPEGRFGKLSRGRAWCRRSDGVFFDDHTVGPGKYSVGSSDGFSRKDRTEWTVAHVTVGDQTWTIAQ